MPRTKLRGGLENCTVKLVKLVKLGPACSIDLADFFFAFLLLTSTEFHHINQNAEQHNDSQQHGRPQQVDERH